MAKSNSKTSVFNGRKCALKAVSASERYTRDTKSWLHKPQTMKAIHNVGRLTKTQRKDAARVASSLKDKKLQNQLVKQHIGAGLIFSLVSRCTNPVWTP